MESLELKLKGITGQYPVACTKRVIELLKDPILSVELEPGQPAEDVHSLLQSVGYHVETRQMDGWVMLKAAKQKK